MILLDVNILLYAFNTNCPEYSTVTDWLEKVIRSEETVGIPWLSAIGFLRVSTTTALYKPAFTPAEAFEALDTLTQNQNVNILDTLDISLKTFKMISMQANTTGKLFPDAYLACLAMQTGSTLASADLDFARFQTIGLKWFNPLA